MIASPASHRQAPRGPGGQNVVHFIGPDCGEEGSVLPPNEAAGGGEQPEIVKIIKETTQDASLQSNEWFLLSADELTHRATRGSNMEAQRLMERADGF